MCDDLFSQSPYCLLHNEFLGLVPIHLNLTLKTLKINNEGKIKDLAELVCNFPAFAPLPKLNSDIEDRKGWDGKSFTSFFKMAVVIFRDILEGDERKCWYANFC